MKIKIFESNKEIDLEKLIDSRMLICANAGAGKSYCVRKILEESNNKVMSIVLDIEGEFKTLRERYDFLLIGEDGDVPLSIQSAKLLPRKLLEMNIPTIIDISELKRKERSKFVKDFLESLMELPRKKEYWKPCLVVLDEAHTLAGQQEKQDSTFAVIDLMTRGRKRGYCGILLTQRISKLHKDAVAECNNYVCGRTSLDIDMKRTADILGFSTKQDMLSLRNLDDGEFYVFGTAISKIIEKEKVGKSKTTHLRRGMIAGSEINKPTDKIKKILNKIASLPEEAKKELKTLHDYKTEIVRLRRDLSKRPKEIQTKEIKVVDERLIERARQQGFREAELSFKKQFQVLEKTNTLCQKKLTDIGKIIGKEIPKFNFQSIQPKPQIQQKQQIIHKKHVTQVTHKSNQPVSSVSDREYDGEIKLSPAYRRLLKSIAMFYPEKITKAKVSILSDVPQKASTFRNGISKLKTQGLITVSGNFTGCTEKGLEIAGDIEQLPTDPEELVNMWCRKLSPAYERIFRCIIDKYPNEISKEDISYESGVPIDASTFRNGLSKIKTLGLIKIESGMVSASPEIMELV